MVFLLLVCLAELFLWFGFYPIALFHLFSVSIDSGFSLLDLVFDCGFFLEELKLWHTPCLPGEDSVSLDLVSGLDCGVLISFKFDS